MLYPHGVPFIPGISTGVLRAGETKSLAHIKISPLGTLSFLLSKLATIGSLGLEPKTSGLEGRYSIQLSYEPYVVAAVGIEPT